MKEIAAARASVITKLTLTAGTIHFGARPGTRTRLGSITVCRVRSARTINQSVSRKAQRCKGEMMQSRFTLLLAPSRETAFSFKYESHNFINNFARSATICSSLLLNSQLAQLIRVRDPLQPP